MNEDPDFEDTLDFDAGETSESSDGGLAALRAETEGLRDQALRYAAEAENTRRRAEREVNDARAYAITKFAKDLLGVADNLARALEHAPVDAGDSPNLVTLCIDQIDADRLALRHRIEESLQRLEQQTLVSRNGEDYFFLTNEERDITVCIQSLLAQDYPHIQIIAVDDRSTDATGALIDTLTAARAQHPTRFTTPTVIPKILALPETAWINKPEEDDETNAA